MTHWIRLASILALGAAQVSAMERIVLPAGKTEADLSVQLIPAPPKDARVTILPLVDSKGAGLEFQPAVADPALAGDELSFHLSEIYFWGDARLQAELQNGIRYTFLLRRGPEVSPKDVPVDLHRPGEVWLHNLETKPLYVKWRVVSGSDSVCGADANGHARQDCSGVSHWGSATLGAARSDRIAFQAPAGWFDAGQVFGSPTRQAQLELAFGSDDNAPVLRIPLRLELSMHLSDALALATPAWLTALAQLVSHLLWVILWVTLGAVMLMLAQVMIPNFRKCMQMETEVEELQERLRAISSRVGDRLYTRCHRELESVRMALGVSSARNGYEKLQDSIALAGNSTEVARIASVLPRIESRIRLTERLDECQAGGAEPDAANVPPSFYWKRASHLRNVREILSRQFITEAEEKSASASLELLDNPVASIKEIMLDLESRIAGLRRQLGMKPWSGNYKELIAGLTGCAELIEGGAQAPPDGGWTTDELIVRDVCAVRLALAVEMISMEALLAAHPNVRALVLERLRSSDPVQLGSAQDELLKLSEGFSDGDVRQALTGGLWDTYFEPVPVTDQDVLRVSLVFRNKSLDRCTAKQGFQCFWKITTKDADNKDVEVYEAGWEAQLMLQPGAVTIAAMVYDAAGNEIAIRPDAESAKGVYPFTVERAAGSARARLMRGLLDAAITAVVPVIAVAVTQARTGSVLPVDELVMLGFTSQAIRAAVIPNSDGSKAG
jgi:hypothetical protein